MRLSENFWFSEFCDRDHHILSTIQMHMLSSLVHNLLEPIRAFLCESFGEDIPITVRSGVRFPSDTNRLRQAGYNPSETSDHLFGNVIKLRSQTNIRKYGKFHSFSVGAADIVPMCGAREAWQRMRPHFLKEGYIALPSDTYAVGQIILERGNSYWLHISNPTTVVYSDHVSQTFLERPHFLLSEDNGRTYTPIT